MSRVLSFVTNPLEGVSVEQALKTYLLDCHTKNLSPGTVAWYESKIKEFIVYLSSNTQASPCPLSFITEQNVKWFIKIHKERENRYVGGKLLSSSTVRGTVVALKAFLKFLSEEGYIKDNIASKIKVPRMKQKIIDTFSIEQINLLLSVPDKSQFTGFRDYTIFLTFLETGIRLSELVNIKLSQIDFSTDTFVVLGKGNKERRVPFGIGLKKVVVKYITWRGELTHDFLFVNQFGEKIQKRRVQEIMTGYGEKLGITGVRMSPHTFRHTYSKMSILNGMDAITLQYLLGHSSLEQVRHYVNLTNQEMAMRTNRLSLVDKIVIKKITGGERNCINTVIPRCSSCVRSANLYVIRRDCRNKPILQGVV